MIKNLDLYVAAAVLGVGLLMSHATRAMDLPEGTYVGIGAGQQKWPCTSNDHDKCPLEASTGKHLQGEIYAGMRYPATDWLTVNGEFSLAARQMESHGRNYPGGSSISRGRYNSNTDSIATNYDHHGVVTSATVRVVPEVEVLDGLHLGPLAGAGGGLFFLNSDTAFAPVVEVGASMRYEFTDGWSLTGRYTYMDTIGGSIAGRDLSYSSHGFLIGLQMEF